MGRISPGPTRWPPGAERRLVPAKSNLKPQTLELIRQWLPVVWEAWYFCMPQPELLQAPPVVARPGAGVRCWEGAVGRERLYRAAVAIAEDWYARRVPVRKMHDAPEFCS